VSLASALERAADALERHAETIRPANGDPDRLLEELTPEGRTEVLQWLLGYEAEAAAELAEAWIEDPPGRDALLAIDEAVLTKPARKALRRVKHRLKSRGIAVGDAAPAPTVARLPGIDESFEEARVSAWDPTGACLTYLALRQASGGVRLLQVALDPSRGVLDAQVFHTTRSKARGFLRELSERGKLAAVEVPIASAQALIARAVAAHPSDRRLPAAFREFRRELTGDPEAPARRPGGLACEALGEEAPQDALETLIGWIEAGELGPWPVVEPLNAAVEKLAELGESTIIVSGARRLEQAEDILSETAKVAFGGAEGEAMIERLHHAAYVRWQQEDEEGARICLAGARAFRDLEPEQNRVALALVRTPLRGALERLEQSDREDTEKSSLLVKP